jgi:hypothetical protein
VEAGDGSLSNRAREPPSFGEIWDGTRNKGDGHLPVFLSKQGTKQGTGDEPNQRGFHCTSNLAAWAQKFYFYFSQRNLFLRRKKTKDLLEYSIFDFWTMYSPCLGKMILPLFVGFGIFLKNPFI